MNRLLFTTITAAVLALCAAATAGDCHHFFPVKQVVQHHAQAVVVPHVAQVVYPQVYYQAGQAIEAEAIAEKAAVRALAKFTAYQQQAARSPAVATPPPVPAAELNIVAEKCGSCHSGPAPKAGLTLDGVTPVPCASVLESLRQIKDDKMPKGGKLSPEEKGLLMEALLALEAE
jgi:hypothetical protein